MVPIGVSVEVTKLCTNKDHDHHGEHYTPTLVVLLSEEEEEEFMLECNILYRGSTKVGSWVGTSAVGEEPHTAVSSRS